MFSRENICVLPFFFSVLVFVESFDPPPQSYQHLHSVVILVTHWTLTHHQTSQHRQHLMHNINATCTISMHHAKYQCIMHNINASCKIPTHHAKYQCIMHNINASCKISMHHAQYQCIMHNINASCKISMQHAQCQCIIQNVNAAYNIHVDEGVKSQLETNGTIFETADNL